MLFIRVELYEALVISSLLLHSRSPLCQRCRDREHYMLNITTSLIINQRITASIMCLSYTLKRESYTQYTYKYYIDIHLLTEVWLQWHVSAESARTSLHFDILSRCSLNLYTMWWSCYQCAKSLIQGIFNNASYTERFIDALEYLPLNMHCHL